MRPRVLLVCTPRPGQHSAKMGELSKMAETEGNADLKREREAHAETRRKLESMSDRYKFKVSEHDRVAGGAASTSVVVLAEEVRALDEEIRRTGEAWAMVDGERNAAEGKAAEAMAEAEALRSIVDEAARMAADAARATALKRVDKELDEARHQAKAARAELEASRQKAEEEAKARAAAEERAWEAEARLAAGSLGAVSGTASAHAHAGASSSTSSYLLSKFPPPPPPHAASESGGVACAVVGSEEVTASASSSAAAAAAAAAVVQREERRNARRSKEPRVDLSHLSSNLSSLVGETTAHESTFLAQLEAVENERARDVSALEKLEGEEELARHALLEAFTGLGHGEMAVGSVREQIHAVCGLYRGLVESWTSERGQLNAHLRAACSELGVAGAEKGTPPAGGLHAMFTAFRGAAASRVRGANKHIDKLRHQLAEHSAAHEAEIEIWEARVRSVESDESVLHDSLEKAYAEVLRLEGALQYAKEQHAGERSQLVLAALQSLKSLRSSFATYAIRKQHRQGAPPESVARGAHGGMRSRAPMVLPIGEALDEAG